MWQSTGSQPLCLVVILAESRLTKYRCLLLSLCVPAGWMIGLLSFATQNDIFVTTCRSPAMVFCGDLMSILQLIK